MSDKIQNCIKEITPIARELDYDVVTQYCNATRILYQVLPILFAVNFFHISDVIDIRDTIEHYDAQGYFLAASSYLTKPLTEHLKRLRGGGKYWVDWWTRSEIEDRLRVNLDIVQRFHNIVRIQQ